MKNPSGEACLVYVFPRAGRGKQRNPPLVCRFNRLSKKGQNIMVIGIAHLQPVVALIAGILILIMPRLLNFIVAIYLIFIGIVGLGVIR